MSKETEEINKIMNLLDFTTTITEIKCDKCGHCDKSYMDEYEAADGFLDKGWSIIKKLCYCPKCCSELE